MQLQKYKIGRLVFQAENMVDGVLINPELPARFDNTPNDWRPASHQRWWHRPFIQTETVEALDRYYAERTDQWAEEGRKQWRSGRVGWLQAWPSGTRFEVRCLDGGAWDRSTCWGMFRTLEEAIACAHG